MGATRRRSRREVQRGKGDQRGRDDQHHRDGQRRSAGRRPKCRVGHGGTPRCGLNCAQARRVPKSGDRSESVRDGAAAERDSPSVTEVTRTSASGLYTASACSEDTGAADIRRRCFIEHLRQTSVGPPQPSEAGATGSPVRTPTGRTCRPPPMATARRRESRSMLAPLSFLPARVSGTCLRRRLSCRTRSCAT